jgi:5-formyltetrahydrofolate cyclo-ligase
LESKDDLRKYFRKLEKSWREEKGQSLAHEQEKLTLNLVEFLKNHGGVWCAFQALPDEPSVSIAIEQSAQILWAYPKVTGQDLNFWIPKHLTNLQVGPFGIQEPRELDSKPAILTEICGMLIPGQAFDREGTRLGRGKSFYDRALQQFKGLKVGVGFSPRVSEKRLPQESWDIRMDYVITEKEVILCRTK